MTLNRESRLYVAGSKTLIGSAILQELERNGYRQVIGREGPDLTSAAAVEAFFEDNKPEYVFFAAGRSGGIEANIRYPADLMIDNLVSQNHVITAAFRHRVKKLLYLASSCSYPRDCRQPMKEEYLLTGLLEPTNEAYAIAKIAGMKLCQALAKQYGVQFISGIPSNAFGPGDDISPEDSHVIMALIRRMQEAKQRGDRSIEIWGTGTPIRDFIFSEDLARASLFVMERYDGREPINLGSGKGFSIAELAGAIREVVGFAGDIRFDRSKPDGMPIKILDSTKLKALGWEPQTPLREALETTFRWYLAQGPETKQEGP
jgi:GDP-L-fucose synthase